VPAVKKATREEETAEDGDGAGAGAEVVVGRKQEEW
jgi:hypothetical protein